MTSRTSRLRWLSRLLGLVTLCYVMAARSAAAHERRLALVSPDAELEHAVALALSPWSVEVIVKHEASPGTHLPVAGEQARALALAWGVTAVVWISPEQHGSLLWIYEADTDSVSTRQLASAPPFSSPNAASVALTLKSLLRLSELRRPAPSPPPALPSPPPLPPEATPSRFTLNAKLNLRYLARDAHETRGAVGGVWWLGQTPGHWGLSLEVSAGPGVDVGSGSFSGQFRQLSLSSAVTWKVIGNHLVASALFAGASAHYVELSGFERGLMRSADLRRVTPSLDTGTEVALTVLSRASLGFSVKALYFPWQERYLAHGARVLETWPVAAEFGARFGVNLL